MINPGSPALEEARCDTDTDSWNCDVRRRDGCHPQRRGSEGAPTRRSNRPLGSAITCSTGVPTPRSTSSAAPYTFNLNVTGHPLIKTIPSAGTVNAATTVQERITDKSLVLSCRWTRRTHSSTTPDPQHHDRPDQHHQSGERGDEPVSSAFRIFPNRGGVGSSNPPMTGGAIEILDLRGR
jgi:hypothetical protein